MANMFPFASSASAGSDVAILDDPLTQMTNALTGNSRPLYTVSRATLRLIMNTEPPPAIEESKLIGILKDLDTRIFVNRGCFNAHMASCCTNLRSLLNPNERREMIGETLAAIAIHERYGRLGWTMVRGHGGAHKGVDQIWVSTEPAYLIVEAKGGNGTLGTAPRYDNSGITHENSVLGSDTPQMSPGWVFIGCNQVVLGKKFTDAMLENKRVVMAEDVHALWICASLWAPRSATVRAFRVGLPAPTDCLKEALRLNDGATFWVPKVTGVVCTNGSIGAEMGLAQRRGPWTVPAPEPIAAWGGRPLRKGSDDDAKGKMEVEE